MSERILVYHGKHGNEFWYARTPEETGKAFLALFKLIDEFVKAYVDAPADQQEYIAWARAGQADAAKYILQWRNGYEYEGWSLEMIKTP